MRTTSHARPTTASIKSKPTKTKIATYIIEGEKLSLEMIVAKYGHEVLAVLRRIKHMEGLQHLDFDDLKQEGYIAMMMATPRFDDSRGLKFSTFIRHRIEGRMRDVIRSGRWRSRGVSEQYAQIGQVEEQLSVELNRMPTMAELSKELGLTPARISHIRARARQGELLSFDDPSFQISPTAQAFGQSDNGYDDAMQQIDDRTALEAVIDELDEKEERAVITLLYYERMPLREIALELRLSESRCSQLKIRAEARLRDKLGEHGRRIGEFSDLYSAHPCTKCKTRLGRLIRNADNTYTCADEVNCEGRAKTALLKSQREAAAAAERQKAITGKTSQGG